MVKANYAHHFVPLRTTSALFLHGGQETRGNILCRCGGERQGPKKARSKRLFLSFSGIHTHRSTSRTNTACKAERKVDKHVLVESEKSSLSGCPPGTRRNSRTLSVLDRKDVLRQQEKQLQEPSTPPPLSLPQRLSMGK